MAEYRNGNVVGSAYIDGAATLGLTGASNSLAYRIAEVERHLHHYERWYGVAGTPSATHKADEVAAAIAAFQIDAGNADWGAWVQILGSADTALTYDLQQMYFVAAETAATVHFVQIGFGATGAAALTAGTYTDFVYRSGAAITREAPDEFQTRRQAAGTLAWARCLAVGVNTSTLDFYFGLHLYEG